MEAIIAKCGYRCDLSSIPEEDFNLFIEPFISKEYLLEIRKSLGT